MEEKLKALQGRLHLERKQSESRIAELSESRRKLDLDLQLALKKLTINTPAIHPNLIHSNSIKVDPKIEQMNAKFASVKLDYVRAVTETEQIKLKQDKLSRVFDETVRSLDVFFLLL